MNKTGKILILLLGLLLAAVLVLVLWLSVTEYHPEPVEKAELQGRSVEEMPAKGDTLSVLTFNIGYAGLGADADSFFDGGSQVRARSESTVSENLCGIADLIVRQDPDITLLQEVDLDSARSYGVNEREALSFGMTAFAPNYVCKYVPYPMPPIGRVYSGLLTVSRICQVSPRRVALPCPFTWPVSAANLKRCLLVSEIPLSGTDQKLLVVNLHLEAYDDGEGKRAQTQALFSFLQQEYEKGNYVIAGGDFNQVFPDTLSVYPIEQRENWVPGSLETESLPEGWQYAYDPSVPTCRLLNQPYRPDDPLTQVYVIDGFILSPNLECRNVATLDGAFEWSDHNPVRLEVRLGD